MMRGRPQALARPKNHTETSAITTDTFINLGLRRTLQGQGAGGQGAEKLEKEGTVRGGGDSYTVFPRSIFFWMARAEW